MSKPPNEPKTELTAAVIRGAVGAVPFAGNLLAEVGNLYLNPLEKRKKAWQEEVGAALDQIQKDLGELPESLQNNEAFVSFLYQATQVALNNHQQEKIHALRAGLVSAASLPSRSEDLAFRFLRLIDELTVSHMRILACLERHAGQFSRKPTLEHVLVTLQGFLGVEIERVQFRALLQDLESRFLIRLTDVEDLPEFASRQETLTTEASQSQPIRVTTLGREFLRFIKASEID